MNIYQNRWTSNKNLITINHNVLNSMSIFGNSWKSYHNQNQTKSNQYLSKSADLSKSIEVNQHLIKNHTKSNQDEEKSIQI